MRTRKRLRIRLRLRTSRISSSSASEITGVNWSARNAPTTRAGEPDGLMNAEIQTLVSTRVGSNVSFTSGFPLFSSRAANLFPGSSNLGFDVVGCQIGWNVGPDPLEDSLELRAPFVRGNWLPRDVVFGCRG